MKRSVIYLSMLTALSAMTLTGCGAGDAPYDEVAKDPDMITSKSIDDSGDKQYLYVRSVGNAPRYAANIAGFSQGREKIVTIRRTAAGLQVREIDRDTVTENHATRFTDDINKAPVLTIPGEYVDYKCSIDSYGHCTNSEEQNVDADVKWQNKKYFVPDFASVAIADIGWSDIGTFSCMKESVSQHLATDGNWKGYEMNLEEGVINIEIEHTYTVNNSCLGKFYHTSLSDLSFTTTEFISIVALDQLVRKNYKAVTYNETAKHTFGFSTTSHKVRNNTYTSGIEGNYLRFINRWDPERENITYYLSNNFFEQKNKPFLDATTEAIKIINAQNEWANTGLPTLKIEQAKEHHHGDLRYSNITLFDEPLDNGLLGYGPHASNPLTGEIVSARVDQYGGNLLAQAKFDYLSLRILYNAGRLDEAQINDLIPNAGYKTTVDIITKTEKISHNPAETKSLFTNSPLHFARSLESENNLQLDNSFGLNPDSIQDGPKSLIKAEKIKAELAVFRRTHNMYATTNELSGKSLTKLPTGLKGYEIDWSDSRLWKGNQVGKELKLFNDLPENVQKDLALKLAVSGYSATLIHELGHNFGLRHNFAGSRDKDNFWGDKDIKELNSLLINATGDKNLSVAAETSSIMDYNLNTNHTLGRYDLAALRYGYARNVLDANGKIHSLKSEDAVRLKRLNSGLLTSADDAGALFKIKDSAGLYKYEFCTDGNLSLNADCNWHDRGTNKSEIVDHFINRYQDLYSVHNVRFDRQNFGENSLLSYTLGRKYTFDALHKFLQHTAMTDDISPSVFSTDYTDTDSKNGIGFWADAYQAREKVGGFFLKVAAQESSIVKVEVDLEDKTTGVTEHDSITYPLEKILDNFAILNTSPEFAIGQGIKSPADDPAAFEALLTEYLDSQLQRKFYLTNLKFTATGKPLNSFNAPNPSPLHPYVNDRDVLGIWPDKLLAVRNLAKHTTISDSSDGHYALLDATPHDPSSNSFGDIFKGMLCKMVQGPNLKITSSKTGLSPMITTEFSDTCFNGPFSAMKADVMALMPNSNEEDLDYASQIIEALDSYDWALTKYFGFDTLYGRTKGKANLLQMMIRQVKLTSKDADTLGQEKARHWREFVSLEKDNYALTPAKISVAGSKVDAKIQLDNGFNYVATDHNILAALLIQRVKNGQAWLKDGKDSTNSFNNQKLTMYITSINSYNLGSTLEKIALAPLMKLFVIAPTAGVSIDSAIQQIATKVLTTAEIKALTQSEIVAVTVAISTIANDLSTFHGKPGTDQLQIDHAMGNQKVLIGQLIRDMKVLEYLAEQQDSDGQFKL